MDALIFGSTIMTKSPANATISVTKVKLCPTMHRGTHPFMDVCIHVTPRVFPEVVRSHGSMTESILPTYRRAEELLN